MLPARLDGMRVLMADDNEAARDIMLRLLESFGLRVDAVASGEEAVAAIVAADARDPYRVAFIDWRMPGLDGIGTVLAIRAKQALRAPPSFVLVSTFSREDIRARAEQSGIDHVLAKPVNPSALEDTLVTLFPPAEGEIAGDPDCPPLPTPTGLEQLRVLLVEDNEINQQIAAELLESVGASVDVACNGRQAVERLERGGVYDVVLMDLQMPVMGGLQATHLIRAEPRFAGLPIVAMTAHALADERQRCFDAGMNGHLAKPIDPGELFRSLAPYGAGRRPEQDVLPPAADPLLAVPGLDVTAGLRRACGNMDLYRKLLRLFFDSQAETVTGIQMALAEANFQLAARLAHTLKGVSAQIGAMPLSELAADVDHAIRDKPTGKMAKALVMRLEVALRRFCTALGAALAAQGGAGRRSRGGGMNGLADSVPRRTVPVHGDNVVVAREAQTLAHQLDLLAEKLQQSVGMVRSQ